jgi:hypothetical protein
VRGEDTLFAHGVDVLVSDRLPVGLKHGFVEKLENKQAGMAFVHVEAIQSVVSKRAQHPYAADAENDL